MDILNLELMPCKQTYEMHIQMHLQVHELAPPTCVLKILVDPFPLSYLSLYDISPSLSSMTIKVQNIDSITCRVEIINVNQWGEDYFPKFGPI